MYIDLSPLAAAKLHLYLHDEKEPSLAVRVIPLTSGCSTPSFALEITERLAHRTIEVQGVPFIYEDWLSGLQIGFHQETGKFSIYHPRPPFQTDCGLEGADHT